MQMAAELYDSDADSGVKGGDEKAVAAHVRVLPCVAVVQMFAAVQDGQDSRRWYFSL